MIIERIDGSTWRGHYSWETSAILSFSSFSKALSAEVIISKYDIVKINGVEYNHNMNIYEIIKGE
mgnify:CR=1 FL=1